MARPPRLGSINCYIKSKARLGRLGFTFDGTTLGLVKRAIANGAVVDSVVHADFGGGFRPYKIVAAPHDDRAGGFWADRA